jgi:hypothetical protein
MDTSRLPTLVYAKKIFDGAIRPRLSVELQNISHQRSVFSFSTLKKIVLKNLLLAT